MFISLRIYPIHRILGQKEQIILKTFLEASRLLPEKVKLPQSSIYPLLQNNSNWVCMIYLAYGRNVCFATLCNDSNYVKYIVALDHLPLLLHGIYCCYSRSSWIHFTIWCALPLGQIAFTFNDSHLRLIFSKLLWASGAHYPHEQRAGGPGSYSPPVIPSQWLEVTGLWRASWCRSQQLWYLNHTPGSPVR